METVNCNLCGSNKTNTLYNSTELGPSTPNDCALVRCQTCGLMYLNPRPSADEIANYYPDDYSCYRPAVEDEHFGIMRCIRRRKLVQRRQIVERYSSNTPGHILDVGCSTGLFLNEMALAGWKTLGVELSPSAAKYARQRFGLKVCEGMLEQSDFSTQSFDTITFWDVLEHTFSPNETLKHTAKLLKPGGLTVINIPNYDSFEREWFGPQWNGFDPPRHLYTFTRPTLTSILQNNGFEVIRWVCFISSYYSLIISLVKWLAIYKPHWAKPAQKALNIPGVRFLFEPFLSLYNWRKRGSVITVLAKKSKLE